MRFRWIVLLTLWTFLSGPILALPSKGEANPPVQPEIQPLKKNPTPATISRCQ